MKSKIFKYKCFTIEIEAEKILIRDEFGDTIDIIYGTKTNKTCSL